MHTYLRSCANLVHFMSSLSLTHLYLTAFKVFGVAKRKQSVKSKPVRKYKSLWYNDKCEQARSEFKSACKEVR